MRCPTCGKSFELGASQAMPFCGPRCRDVDLGRWFNEEQRVPAKSLEVEDEAEPDDAGRPKLHSDDADDTDNTDE